MPENGRKTCGALLALHAQTALHPGAGTALGTVDLPVQRERHTHWPIIAGSALKGILRDDFREKVKKEYKDDGDEVPEKERRNARRKANEEHENLVALFGPGKIDPATAHAGALSITDARLLAYPVRSLKGVFAWVSCPAVLDRLKRDAELAALELPWNFPDVDDHRVALHPSCPCSVDGKIVLEEFDFTPIQGSSQDAAEWIAKNLLPDIPAFAKTRERFGQHFLILSDNDFTHFVRFATEVVARIGLDYETKTVKTGALFYQEFLPAESLFYAVVLVNAARTKNGAAKDSEQMLGRFRENSPTLLQVGGDETIGKGLCAVRITNGGTNNGR